jgi:hypothetical protein
MSCESGLMPRGAQHGRGRFIRPKRASSANMIRSRRPRRAAARHHGEPVAPQRPIGTAGDQAHELIVVARLDVVGVSAARLAQATRLDSEIRRLGDRNAIIEEQEISLGANLLAELAPYSSMCAAFLVEKVPARCLRTVGSPKNARATRIKLRGPNGFLSARLGALAFMNLRRRNTGRAHNLPGKSQPALGNPRPNFPVGRIDLALGQLNAAGRKGHTFLWIE